MAGATARIKAALAVSPKLRPRLISIGLHVALGVLALVFLSPFYWMVISALRPLSETTSFPVRLVPSTASADAFLRLLADTNFGRTLLNSILVTSATTGLAIAVCVPAGYALGMFQFRGRRSIFGLVLIAMVIPSTVQLVPNYLLLSKLGLLDNWLALILPGAATPIGAFWMRQYILATMPRELLDAARVDGARELTILLRVVVPLILPGVASLSIFVSTLAWNDFVLPFVYLNSADLLTFPARLIQFYPARGQIAVPYDLIMAGAVLSTIPVLVVYVALQRYFVTGLTFGSVK
jgi:ABC-type glycerol-3-phosphate transport system permease component